MSDSINQKSTNLGASKLVSGMTSTNSTQEFDKMLLKKSINVNLTEFYLKKTALDAVDKFFWYLPKSRQALQICIELAINSGIQIQDVKDSDSLATALEPLQNSINGDILDFFSDIIRLLKTKGNCVLILRKSDDGYFWEIVEPHRYSLIGGSENTINAKYNIVAVKVKNKNNVETFDLKKDKNIIIIKNNPSNIFGIPPLLFNEPVHNTVVAEIERQFYVANSGAYGKNIIGPKKDSNIDAENLLKDINSTLQDASKGVFVTNQEIEISKVDAVQGDPKFWENYINNFTSVTAGAFGVSPSYLINTNNINRSTKEQEYKEMIQYTINPLNNKLNKILHRMLNVMIAFGIKIENKVGLYFFERPKQFLDVKIKNSDYLTLEKEGVIKTNELRSLLGLSPMTEEELANRENNRFRVNNKVSDKTS
jgi:hypothetical protein